MTQRIASLVVVAALACAEASPRPEPDTSLPLRHIDAAVAWDPVRAELVSFGGRTSAGLTAETWVFDGQSWTLRDAPGPRARSRASLAWHPALERLVLFGGEVHEAGTLVSDTWTWDGNAWTELGRGPAVHARAPLFWDGARLLLYDADRRNFRGLWTLTSTGWQAVEP